MSTPLESPDVATDLLFSFSLASPETPAHLALMCITDEQQSSADAKKEHRAKSKRAQQGSRANLRLSLRMVRLLPLTEARDLRQSLPCMSENTLKAELYFMAAYCSAVAASAADSIVAIHSAAIHSACKLVPCSNDRENNSNLNEGDNYPIALRLLSVARRPLRPTRPIQQGQCRIELRVPCELAHLGLTHCLREVARVRCTVCLGLAVD
ncbi:hypothetical protein BCV70DRAFT_8720 [Testicularia cyperi]|uniref:Uncharacterized protein n=1 Tax=Testicularia cyperi TaxID=1882483 RepID=A0A317XX98_9BASI|nr:hypothetical protein BCV70DRAFT_8720 [Testicularia cyperi]